jgi:single-stranded-DNA-specific exonuclease
MINLNLIDEKITSSNCRKILVAKSFEKEASEIAISTGLNIITSSILSSRGFKNNEKLRQYLNPTLKNGISDPFLIKNLKEASERIIQAMSEKKKIAICCDFDVDGLTGGAQLITLCRDTGTPVQSFVPDRFTEGYGLNIRMIDEALDCGCQLLLSVDFGTKNPDELIYAKNRGLETIVIDHHYVGDDTVPCDVLINPQQTGCGFADGMLSASGLVWHLILGIRNILRNRLTIEPKKYLDLACLGTICDMVPLLGINRVLAKKGLDTLNLGSRPGIKAIIEDGGIKGTISSYEVSFAIGPRINAAGRMEQGNLVLDLLTTRDSSKAKNLAKKLSKLNIDRQKTEDRVREIAIKEVESMSIVPYGIVVANANFHPGVIGIVAQRLVEKYKRPAAVIGCDNLGVFKGSVRGISGISVVNLLNEVSHLLDGFGGHEGAGGFTVQETKVPCLVNEFNAVCSKYSSRIDSPPPLVVDAKVSLQELTFDLIDEFNIFSPFGVGNKNPLLLLENVVITHFNTLSLKHLKIIFNDGNLSCEAVWWRRSSHYAVKVGNRVNVAFRPSKNLWNGRVSLQAHIEDIELIS